MDCNWKNNEDSIVVARTKIYKIVKEVDKALIDLTNSVLDKEKNSLDILSRVGEIKGLLINMYT